MILIVIFEDLIRRRRRRLMASFLLLAIGMLDYSSFSVSSCFPLQKSYLPFFPSRQLLSSNRDRFSTLIVGSRAKEGLSSARKRNTRPVYFAKNNNHFSALLVARGLERFYLFDSRTAPRLFKIICVETRWFSIRSIWKKIFMKFTKSKKN